MTNTCTFKLDSKYCNVFIGYRLMEWFVETRSRNETAINLNMLNSKQVYCIMPEVCFDDDSHKSWAHFLCIQLDL